MAKKLTKTVEIKFTGNSNKATTQMAQDFNKVTGAVKQTENAMEDLAAQQQQMNQSAGLAGASLTEMSRVISDAPYGLRGMANNLGQLATLMGGLVAKAGGVGGAIKAMGAAFKGPLGFIIIVQTAITLLQTFSKRIFASKEGVDEFGKTISKNGEAVGNLMTLGHIVKNTTEGTDEYRLALEELKSKGFDPLSESVDAFIGKQIRLMTLDLVLKDKTQALADNLKKQAEIQDRITNIEGKESAGSGRSAQGQEAGRVRQLKALQEELTKTQEGYEKLVDSASSLMGEQMGIKDSNARGKAKNAASKKEDKEEKGKVDTNSLVASLTGVNPETVEEYNKLLEKAASMQESYNQKTQDLQAIDDQAALELMKNRDIAKIEAMSLALDQENQLKLAAEEYYAEKSKQITEETEQAKREAKLKTTEDNLDNLARMFGEESKAGQAALLLKMNFAAIENAINDGITWNKIKGDIAGGVTDFFSGVGKAAKAAPFPLNVPLIAGHIATAAPVLGQLKAAAGLFKGKKKGVLPSAPTPSAGGGGSVRPPQMNVQAPDFNLIGQGSNDANIISNAIEGKESTMKAYVVSSEVSGSQELERKAKDVSKI